MEKIKIIAAQTESAIREWVRREKKRKISRLAFWISCILLLGYFIPNIVLPIISGYYFLKLSIWITEWFQSEYRYTMERRRLFLKILDKIEKRVADEEKPLF